MLKKITIITFSSFIYFACSIFAQAEIVHASIYQSEQDKARKEALSLGIKIINPVSPPPLVK